MKNNYVKHTKTTLIGPDFSIGKTRFHSNFSIGRTRLIDLNFYLLNNLALFGRKYSTIQDKSPFFSPIPIEYIRSKTKTISFYVNMVEFYNKGIYDLTKYIESDVRYTVYIKVRYNEDSYFMAGNQFGFKYCSKINIDELYDIITARFEDYFSHYNLTDEDIVYVELIFRKFDTKLLSEFSINDFISKDDYTNNNIMNISKNMLNIPVSTYDKYLGKPLNVVIEDGRITNIPIKINGKDINFLDTILDKTKLLGKNHKDNINSFDSGFNFYLLRDRTEYILAIKQIGDSFVKIKYSLSGVIINRVTDTNVHDGGNDFFIRKSGGKEILFDINYKPVKLLENIPLRAIEKVQENKKLFVSDPNLGVIDTETFLSNDGTQKIYALGFKTNLQDEAVVYYIDKNELDSTKINYPFGTSKKNKEGGV